MRSELAVGILPCELPVNSSPERVSILLPSLNLAFQRFAILNPATQALAAEDADFDLGHIEPTGVLWRVVELHSAQ